MLKNEVQQVLVILVRMIAYKSDGRSELARPESVPGKSLADETTGRPGTQQADSDRGAKMISN